MMRIAEAQVMSSAPAESFFDCWADMATWHEWNADTEWVRLDGPFVQGATGKLKPKGGPTVKFVVERLVPGREFVDVSYLVGARLVFDHQVRQAASGTVVDVTVTIHGPLSWLWNLLIGKGIRQSCQRDLERLVARAEAGATRAGA
jgi:hypothetical protein